MTREEAIFTLQEAVDESFGAGIEIITRDGCEAIEMAIEALEERKTGKWIERDRDHQCTNCEGLISKYIPWYLSGLPNYCPFCGAKMEVDA